MDKAKILERWKDLNAQRAQRNKAKSEFTSTLDNSGDSAPSSDHSTSVSDATAESNTQRSTGSWTMVSEKPSTTPSAKNGGSGVPVWGPEPPSPVVADIFKLIADLEQQPGRNHEALQTAESHAYAMEMELQNCRMAQEIYAKRIRELEERLRVAEEQVEEQKRAIDNLREENVAQDSRIVDLEQALRRSDKAPDTHPTSIGTKPEHKKPTCLPTVKKKVSSLFQRNCQSDRR